MNLVLEREKPSSVCTIGSLYVNGMWECWTLEPASPMPQGTYTISLYDSPRFGRLVPLLSNVPGHSFIEIHPGNTAADTHDCILPGMKRGENCVLESRVAFEDLFAKMQTALGNAEMITIRIEDAPEAYDTKH